MKYQINLFPEKEWGFTEKITYFAFHYLRYILVITQLVVIAVFFYRFNVDQDIVDKKDLLQQKHEIIQVEASLLAQASDINKKTQNINTVLSEQTTNHAALNYFLSVFPEGIHLTKFSLQKDIIRCSGYTDDANLIRIFYNRLLKDKKFKQVILGNVVKKDIGFNFSLDLMNFTSK